MTNIFKTVGDTIVCNVNLTLFLEKTNVMIRDDEDFDVILFGSVIVAEDKGEQITKTITLGTMVRIPIVRRDQYREYDDHYIIDFIAGDVIVANRFVPKSIDNVDKVFKIFTNGHLSKLVPYHLYYKILNNVIDNNEKMKFPKILLEMMISEMFLDTNGKKLRRTGENYGMPASIDDIVQTSGAFNSMTFEDPDKSILINKGKSKSDQMQLSKLEQYFKK